ncbi:prepilin peptidase [Pseudomonas sp. JS3066]|jgi:prepilin peptidase CpaA|uniref:prepilin peptidase n=1 Tax=unclassified Pseudomonas TaxID=196821 RepID=UPI000EA9905A|nr:MULTISPECIES: prepilin peptidase [unclassified Pseudomonas]AYF89893.1 prepilin peptidase [Pseudomonas sp. DY-1]WVK92520.1 prepilin peptidase [Pseudomonas sp. JS3066]
MSALPVLFWIALCALQDIRQRRISNWLTFGGSAVALLYLLLRGETLLGATPSQALAAAGLALLLTLPGWWLGKLGAADVKLLVGIALCSNSLFTLYCLVGAGLAYLSWATLSRPLWPALPTSFRQTLAQIAPERVHRYPYGPFLFAGSLMAFFV